jgi:hypothetical protein
VILCDEIFFMNEETILQGILPVAQQQRTCLIGTTTPAGTDHIVSAMISARDKYGNPVIRTVRIGAPCEECRRMQVLCTHAENTVAEGTSRKKRDRYKALYAERKHIMMREYQGEIGDASRKIFQASWIHRLTLHRPVPVPENVDMLFLTSDPAQGGDCEWSTVGAYYDRISGCMVICLLDSFTLKPATPHNMRLKLEGSVSALRCAHPAFRSAPIVYCVESAPKMFAEAVAEYADEIARTQNANIVCMNESSDGRPGVPKTAQNTMIMSEVSQRFMENNAIRFSASCTTSVEGSSVADERKKLLGQLQRYARKIDEKTGKVRIDGKDGGANDDYAVAFVMQGYWYKWFWDSTNERYASVKQYSSKFRSTAFASNGKERFTLRGYEMPIEEEKKASDAKRQRRGTEINNLMFML